tara:strand:- start:2432 stop:2596 length:165 start_codon:yes stop_codon:yes gene_type:complete
MRIVEVKERITSDFILDLYDKAKKMKSQEKKAKLMKQIKILSQHLGEYMVKSID